jgi:hypothetical protein
VYKTHVLIDLTLKSNHAIINLQKGVDVMNGIESYGTPSSWRMITKSLLSHVVAFLLEFIALYTALSVAILPFIALCYLFSHDFTMAFSLLAFTMAFVWINGKTSK